MRAVRVTVHLALPEILLREVAVGTCWPPTESLQAPTFNPRTSCVNQYCCFLCPPGKWPGQCPCRKGYAGDKCDRCQFGYRGFPNCVPCDCSTVGSVNEDPCTEPCLCKVSVEIKGVLSLFWVSLFPWIRRSCILQSREA